VRQERRTGTGAGTGTGRRSGLVRTSFPPSMRAIAASTSSTRSRIFSAWESVPPSLAMPPLSASSPPDETVLAAASAVRCSFRSGASRRTLPLPPADAVRVLSTGAAVGPAAASRITSRIRRRHSTSAAPWATPPRLANSSRACTSTSAGSIDGSRATKASLGGRTRAPPPPSSASGVCASSAAPPKGSAGAGASSK
jgi:hypothetical protein